jgi:hypothetical protein
MNGAIRCHTDVREFARDYIPRGPTLYEERYILATASAGR